MKLVENVRDFWGALVGCVHLLLAALLGFDYADAGVQRAVRVLLGGFGGVRVELSTGTAESALVALRTRSEIRRASSAGRRIDQVLPFGATDAFAAAAATSRHLVRCPTPESPTQRTAHHAQMVTHVLMHVRDVQHVQQRTVPRSVALAVDAGTDATTSEAPDRNVQLVRLVREAVVVSQRRHEHLDADQEVLQLGRQLLDVVVALRSENVLDDAVIH